MNYTNLTKSEIKHFETIETVSIQTVSFHLHPQLLLFIYLFQVLMHLAPKETSSGSVKSKAN